MTLLTPSTVSRKMTFDDLLIEAGGFGRFQVTVLLILCIPRLILPLNFLQHIFISAVPAHHCAIPDQRNLGNLSQEELLLINIPREPNGLFSSCKMYSQPQLHLILNSSQDPLNGTEVQSCDGGWEYDLSTFSSTTVTQWDLVCARRGLSKLLVTIFFSGVMLGGVIFGYLSDRYGRRTMLLAAFLLAVVFGGLSAGSVSYSMFIVSLGFLGLALSGVTITVIALSVEWVDTRHRTDAAIVTSFCWSIGNASLALLAYIVRDWRWLMAASTAPCILGVISIWWLPESARWLLTKGRADEAEALLAQCAAANGSSVDVFKKNSESIRALADTRTSSQNYSYINLFRTPRLRKISICAALVWFAVAFSYYGISLNIGSLGFDVYLTHFLYALVEFPGKLSVYFLMKYVGRRRTQVFTLLMTGVCIGVAAATPDSLGAMRTAVAIVGKGFSEATFTALILYTAELYPTVIRQNGIGYTAFFGRLGASVAPLMLLLNDVWYLLPEMIFCSAAIICSMVAYLLPETLNIPLPETIQDVEHGRGSDQQKNSIITLADLCPEGKNSATPLNSPHPESKNSATTLNDLCLEGKDSAMPLNDPLPEGKNDATPLNDPCLEGKNNAMFLNGHHQETKNSAMPLNDPLPEGRKDATLLNDPLPEGKNGAMPLNDPCLERKNNAMCLNKLCPEGKNSATPLNEPCPEGKNNATALNDPLPEGRNSATPLNDLHSEGNGNVISSTN